MEKSKVYFTNFRAKPDRNVLQKLRHLIEAAGMTSMPLEGKFTAIKMHFGEPGNLAFLRPNYAKVVVDTLKDMGARPFLTDCNTLYTGMRRNALDHLTAAFENGFGPLQTGCHVIIADGLLGNDHVSVPIDGEYCKEALIGRAAMDADAIISLTHFKCHEGTGIGGALKNLGMGLGSTASVPCTVTASPWWTTTSASDAACAPVNVPMEPSASAEKKAAGVPPSTTTSAWAAAAA